MDHDRSIDAGDSCTADDVLGIDVGGTSIKGVRVDPAGRVVREHRAPTPAPDPTGERVAVAVAAVAARLTGPVGPPLAAGVVVPGIVDESTGTAVWSVNLGWRDVPLLRLLADRLDGPVALGHDVRAGALAEARTGAARDETRTVAFVPVGTGVSAALVVEGRPVVSGGWAGEIGQRVLVHGPFAGLRSEEVASASATARRAGAPDARTVAERVAAGDPEACAVWADTVEALADAITDLVVAVAPGTVVVGGGLALAGDLLLTPLAAALSRRTGALRVPRLVPARHGDAAAALGAAMLARDTRGATVPARSPGRAAAPRPAPSPTGRTPSATMS